MPVHRHVNLGLCGSSELTILTMVATVNNGSNILWLIILPTIESFAQAYWNSVCLEGLGSGHGGVRSRSSNKKKPKAHVEGQIFVWLGF